MISTTQFEASGEPGRETNVANQLAQSARLQISHELNQLFRRFRHYEKEADWVSLVMEGAVTYARQIALLAVQGNHLELRGAAQLDVAEPFRFEAKNAAAFEAVLRSKEATTALRTEREVGVPFSSPGTLAYLFPIMNGPRVAAILFVAAEEAEVNQLELVANMASSALERHANHGMHAQIGTVPPVVSAPAAVKPEPHLVERGLPTWADMPAEQRDLHSQAARYARVVVAEMQLFKPAACRAGLEKGDLYVILGKEIDRAREPYKKQFMIIPSMTDYVHRELVSSILGGDAKKLGADYPGELA